mmetsp:Transcript_4039/g.12029  ORF Transcript_4039/g.12029 Transcript_4039/m.12029 type:complete len:685 (-) Transcript_4039:243-2297(-)
MGGRRQEGGGHRWLPRHADGAGVLPSDQDALDELQLVVASRVRPALGDGHHSVSAADGHFDAAAARGQGAHPAALPHQRDGRAARVDVDAQPGDVALQPVRRVLHPAWPHRLGGGPLALLQGEGADARGHGGRRGGVDGALLRRRRLGRPPMGALFAHEPVPLLQLRVAAGPPRRRALCALLRRARRVHHRRRRPLDPHLAGGSGRARRRARRQAGGQAGGREPADARAVGAYRPRDGPRVHGAHARVGVVGLHAAPVGPERGAAARPGRVVALDRERARRLHTLARPLARARSDRHCLRRPGRQAVGSGRRHGAVRERQRQRVGARGAQGQALLRRAQGARRRRLSHQVERAARLVGHRFGGRVGALLDAGGCRALQVAAGRRGHRARHRPEGWLRHRGVDGPRGARVRPGLAGGGPAARRPLGRGALHHPRAREAAVPHGVVGPHDPRVARLHGRWAQPAEQGGCAGRRHDRGGGQAGGRRRRARRGAAADVCGAAPADRAQVPREARGARARLLLQEGGRGGPQGEAQEEAERRRGGGQGGNGPLAQAQRPRVRAALVDPAHAGQAALQGGEGARPANHTLQPRAGQGQGARRSQALSGCQWSAGGHAGTLATRLRERRQGILMERACGFVLVGGETNRDRRVPERTDDVRAAARSRRSTARPRSGVRIPLRCPGRGICGK